MSFGRALSAPSAFAWSITARASGAESARPALMDWLATQTD